MLSPICEIYIYSKTEPDADIENKLVVVSGERGKGRGMLEAWD